MQCTELSIIIPVRNIEQEISEFCVPSLLKQQAGKLNLLS